MKIRVAVGSMCLIMGLLAEESFIKKPAQKQKRESRATVLEDCATSAARSAKELARIIQECGALQEECMDIAGAIINQEYAPNATVPELSKKRDAMQDVECALDAMHARLKSARDLMHK